MMSSHDMMINMIPQQLLLSARSTGPPAHARTPAAVFRFFLVFNLQMPDTKLRPTSRMKTLKSREQRFGHVNNTTRNSCLNIVFIKLVTQ